MGESGWCIDTAQLHYTTWWSEEDIVSVKPSPRWKVFSFVISRSGGVRWWRNQSQCITPSKCLVLCKVRWLLPNSIIFRITICAFVFRPGNRLCSRSVGKAGGNLVHRDAFPWLLKHRIQSLSTTSCPVDHRRLCAFVPNINSAIL
jgi:hypothetical protein